MKIEKQKIYDFTIDTFYDIIGSILYAAGIYTFALSANFAPGGISGLSIIINHFTKIPIGTCSLLLNIPIIIISYKVLGKWFLVKSLKTMVISAFFMDMVFPLFPIYSGNPLLAAVFAGVLSGAGLALIYMRNSSTGGTDFLILSVRKKAPHLSIGQITIAIDGCVILLGGVVFGTIDAVLLGIIMTIATSTIIDKIMSGFEAGKMAMVITNHGKEIADVIGREVGRGVTIMNVTGAFSGESRQMLMCACSKSQVYNLRRIVSTIDPTAMTMISSFDEAFGLGFKDNIID
ncbi:YitT family protein [uncultured Clostridium sp.]|uniref:YitT family protein n=1 Tax=uncultured Clostridium sp. TaxID=59620 RepID=UPI003217E0CF